MKSLGKGVLILLSVLLPMGRADATSVTYDNLGTFTTTLLSQGGIEVTGSGTINVSNLNGLGVVGGSNDNFLDGTEYLDFVFVGGSAVNVGYTTGAGGNLDGDGTVGDRFLQAFDLSGNSLGSVAQTGVGGFAVSSLFGDVPISRFRITADVDRIIINSVQFDQGPAIPEPTTGLLLLTGLAALPVKAAFRKASRK